MVNITYDACEFLLVPLRPKVFDSRPALGMVVTNADGVRIEYNLGDMAWLMAAMTLVFIMIPGVGYFYSGLLRRKNALSMLWTSMLSIAVVSLQARISVI